jgi:hypothetical protein
MGPVCICDWNLEYSWEDKSSMIVPRPAMLNGFWRESCRWRPSKGWQARVNKDPDILLLSREADTTCNCSSLHASTQGRSDATPWSMKPFVWEDELSRVTCSRHMIHSISNITREWGAKPVDDKTVHAWLSLCHHECVTRSWNRT